MGTNSKITGQDVRNYLEGNAYYLLSFFKSTSPTHIKEQALYRAFLCDECLKKGKCVECGCKTPNMFFSPKKKDSKGRWGQMLSAKEWKKFKIENNIDINNLTREKMATSLRYFNPVEFTMGGTNVFDNMNKEFLLKIDELRARCGVPFIVISSYRSPSYNRRIGGASRSYHLVGRAVDIEAKSSAIKAKIIREALAMGLSVGVMKNALHIDDREEKNQVLFHYYSRYQRNTVERQTEG